MRYPPLMIALFLWMTVRPFAQHFESFSVPWGVFLLLVFLTLIYAFRHVRRLAVCLTILAVTAVTLRFGADHWQGPELDMLSLAPSFIAMVVAGVAILSEVLRARSASSDLVIGAVCLYIVIGVAWAFLYYSIYLLSPASIFVSPASTALTTAVRESKFTEALFFSLSALTTIGSSGEEALTQMTRQLAVVESVMGQLYLAVLISRLVGFSAASDTKGRS
jgi:Ion channel